MVTLYRAATQLQPRASATYGLHAATKPTDVINGAYFVEIDTGAIYRYDAEGTQWIAQPSGDTGGDLD